MLSLELNVSGKLIVVVGGGRVGCRRAITVREAGSIVHLIEPNSPAVEGLTGIIHIPESYRIKHLNGACLVIAAATPEVNDRVVADAHQRGIWVNSASNSLRGDVIIPASMRQGGLSVSVSTGGASPALARRVRDLLAVQFDAAFADWVELLEEFRELVFDAIPEPTQRHHILDEVADWPWLTRLRLEGTESIRLAMKEIVSEYRPKPGVG